jgi:hypothetical protein
MGARYLIRGRVGVDEATQLRERIGCEARKSRQQYAQHAIMKKWQSLLLIELRRFQNLLYDEICMGDEPMGKSVSNAN